MDIKVTNFVCHDTGLVAATLSTPKGELRFSGCWDSRVGKWHVNSQPIWKFHSYNPNGSENVEEVPFPPKPTKPTERSFQAAVRAWFKTRYPRLAKTS